MTPSQSGGAKRRKSSGPDLSSAEAVQESIRDKNYIADKTLATTLFLALKLEKPIINDLLSKNGQPTAFTMGQRYVLMEKLARARVTSELT